MKVHLMYRDRDFDLQQPLPVNEAALTQDLELNTLCNAMARADGFLYEVAAIAVLCSLTDSDAIRYRQEVLQDCLKNPTVVRDIYQIPLDATANKRHHWMGVLSRYHPSSILYGANQMLQMFITLLKKLRGIADEHAGKFSSEGFRRFFAMLQSELDDTYFAEVEAHLQALEFHNGVLLSAELGQGNESGHYVLRELTHDNWQWVKQVFTKKSPVYSFSIHPRDDHSARALGELKDRGINLVANALAQSADHIDSFFKALQTELAFYIGGLNLYEQLDTLGEPITFPIPAPPTARHHTFTGLYDVCLALTMRQKVVGNDVNAEGKDLVIITGANQGGKSTFLRSIGLAQLMMQCGMFVAAEAAFHANSCRGLFTHYRREEDTTMKSGKLDEELSRMSTIIGQLTPDCMVLFNESFAATNEREGAEIARQIVRALLDKHIKVFFVTHLYTLARDFYVKDMENALFLRAERQEDGSRTFKLNEGQPLETSFGEDLYQQIFEKNTQMFPGHNSQLDPV
ncbi:MAG: DNA mismatch repair protein MutS [Anaerolineae bacterium]|nr:DNA mismatch repair protein MutS [Anaerolineae bacterium]